MLDFDVTSKTAITEIIMKKIITFVILALLGTTVSAETISFNRLNKIQINDKIKKIFISEDLITNDNDKYKYKNEVISYLKDRLGNSGKYTVAVGKPVDVDLNKETVAIISGEVISSGEVVTGQFSEVAYCKGGLVGLLSDFAAVASSTNISVKSMKCQQCSGEFDKTTNMCMGTITIGTCEITCKSPSLPVEVTEFVAGLLLGPSPEIQVIRIYKYKNISLFLQVNLSITEFGKVRKMVYSRTDSSSFGRHYTQPGSLAHVRESSQGSGIILPLVQEIMAAPMPEELAIVKASNPGSAIGKWYDRIAPDADDIPEGETKSIRKQLVHKAVNEFVKNIVPHKIEVDIEIDSKGNEDAIKLIKEGNYTEAIKTIKNVDPLQDPDMYNLALLLEATASIKDNYEEALSYYIQLNDKIQDDRYIEGIGRIEKVIRNMKRIKNI